jgi:ketosteroid isomerase-like protein
MSTWIDDYYADVDAMRLDAFVERHSEDAVVTFANNPPAVGKEAIRAAIGGFWSMIGGLRHERRNLWFVGDTAILEAVTHYTTKGGAAVPLPVVSLLERNADGKVSSLRFYIDLAPLFAQINAEQPETITA